MTPTFRKAAASEDDLLAVFGLLLAMHAECAIAELDVDKALGWIAGTLGRGMTVLAELGGRPVGSVGLTVHTLPYAAEEFLANEWLYAVPEHRRAVAPGLIEAAGRMAEEQAKALILTETTGRKRGRVANRWMIQPVGRVMAPMAQRHTGADGDVRH